MKEFSETTSCLPQENGFVLGVQDMQDLEAKEEGMDTRNICSRTKEGRNKIRNTGVCVSLIRI